MEKKNEGADDNLEETLASLQKLLQESSENGELAQKLAEARSYKIPLIVATTVSNVINISLATLVTQMIVNKLGWNLTVLQSALLFIGLKSIALPKYLGGPSEATLTVSRKDAMTLTMAKTVINIGLFIALNYWVF